MATTETESVKPKAAPRAPADTVIKYRLESHERRVIALEPRQAAEGGALLDEERIIIPAAKANPANKKQFLPGELPLTQTMKDRVEVQCDGFIGRGKSFTIVPV